MSKVDPDAVIRASNRFYASRRWFFRTFLGMWGLGAFGVLFNLAFGSRLSSTAQDVFAAVLSIVFLACWLVGLASLLSLYGLRCPRCGGRFIVSTYDTLPTSACKHCGFKLEPIRKPIAKEATWDLE